MSLIYLPMKSIFKIVLRGKITVFLFHDVADSPSAYTKETGIWLSNSDFRSCMDFISRFFEVVDPKSLREISTSYDKNKRYALISFDDCWSSIKVAVQVCNREFNVVPLVFINGKTIENGKDAAAIKQYQTKERTQTFEEFQGLVMNEVDLDVIDNKLKAILASHLYEHFPASTLSFKEFTNQFDKNMHFLKRFRCFREDFFAFPHGAEGKDFNDLHLNFLKNIHNVDYVFSADSGFNTFNTLKKKSIRRIHITHEFATDLGIIYLLFRGLFLNSRKK